MQIGEASHLLGLRIVVQLLRRSELDTTAGSIEGVQWKHTIIHSIYILSVGIDASTILCPAESALFVDIDKILPPLFSVQILDSFGFQLCAWENSEIDVFPSPNIEPVEEVFCGILKLLAVLRINDASFTYLLLPILMIRP